MDLRISLIITLLFGMISANAQINKKVEMETLLLNENGNFPNNPQLPVLVYKNVFDFSGNDPVSTIEAAFASNGWGSMWRNGIYNFQHYHSTAHEALGIYGGWAEVQLGGPGNDPVRIEKGDLVVLPAGTAHKKISSGDGFAVVGAYPDGQSWDMNYGKDGELPKTKMNIAKVALPTKDPVFGKGGKMFDYWK